MIGITTALFDKNVQEKLAASMRVLRKKSSSLADKRRAAFDVVSLHSLITIGGTTPVEYKS